MTWIKCKNLTLSTLNILKKHNRNICRKCSLELKLGDNCIHNDGANTRWYHEECYEKMLY